MLNPFFKNNGPFYIEDLLNLSHIRNVNRYKGNELSDIKDLALAKKNNITFFHSKKYETLAVKTEASFCITTKNLSYILPSSCNPIIVNNVLIATSKITKIFYPDSVTDDFDEERGWPFDKNGLVYSEVNKEEYKTLAGITRQHLPYATMPQVWTHELKCQFVAGNEIT